MVQVRDGGGCRLQDLATPPASAKTLKEEKLSRRMVEDGPRCSVHLWCLCNSDFWLRRARVSRPRERSAGVGTGRCLGGSLPTPLAQDMTR